jgi:hypothetical protein
MWRSPIHRCGQLQPIAAVAASCSELQRLAVNFLRFNSSKNRIALAPAFVQYSPMLARVLSTAVNGIEVFPVEVEVNSGWSDTVVVLKMSLSPILRLGGFRLGIQANSSKVKCGAC